MHKNREEISIIQFTDLHLDLDYAVGSATNCKSVMCCRKEYGFPDIPEYQAGEYGSLAKCCTPVSVLKKMGEKINELSPDALFWTGDTVPYDL